MIILKRWDVNEFRVFWCEKERKLVEKQKQTDTEKFPRCFRVCLLKKLNRFEPRREVPEQFRGVGEFIAFDLICP